MVKLRLTRIGKKHAPAYRIIAIQARTKREGKALEFLGFYNPRNNPSVVELDAERVKYWLQNGAQPTDTVRDILIKQGIIKAKGEKRTYAKRPGRKKQQKAAANETKEVKTEVKAEIKEAEKTEAAAE